MNEVLEKNRINFRLRAKGNKLEPIHLDGPRAKKIIACHQELIDAIISPDKAELTDSENFWRKCMSDVWKQWESLDENFQNTDFETASQYDYGKEARRLGLYWSRAFTSQFMGSNYLHIVVFHTAQYWRHLKQFGMTFGLFSTTGLNLLTVPLMLQCDALY